MCFEGKKRQQGKTLNSTLCSMSDEHTANEEGPHDESVQVSSGPEQRSLYSQ